MCVCMCVLCVCVHMSACISAPMYVGFSGNLQNSLSLNHWPIDNRIFTCSIFSPLPVASIIMVICPVSQIPLLLLFSHLAYPEMLTCFTRKVQVEALLFFFFFFQHNRKESVCNLILKCNCFYFFFLYSYIIFNLIIIMQNKLYAY